jgi:hypothetical protein
MPDEREEMPGDSGDPFVLIGSFSPEEAKKITPFLEAEGIEFEVEIVESRGAMFFGGGLSVDLYVHSSKLTEAEVVLEVVMGPGGEEEA